MQVNVKRKEAKYLPDCSRVIAQFTDHREETGKRIIKYVINMSDEDVSREIGQVLRDYVKRHRNITKIFERNFGKLENLFKELEIKQSELSHERKILIGSYYTKEYSVESTAFFNPSIVLHPDQTELQPGDKRVILSFRATGEGHISSIVFRTGIIDKDNNLSLRSRGIMLDEPEKVTQFVYNKQSFKNKLEHMKFYDNTLPPSVILKQLDESFTYKDLKKVVDETKKTYKFSEKKTLSLDQIMWVAFSHYEVVFSLDTSLSERIIFPIAITERNGIEDARFVRFTDEDGSCRYYATYTAWDGSIILPKIIETESFYKFRFSPLEGKAAINKGMALFPKKIKGKYVMMSRIDGINNYISFSDDCRVWNKAKLLQEPKHPWELIKIGNCGSPIETDEGWLVISHGVGPMKEYVIGASLFDLDDPTKEIGRLRTPLMMPDEGEREGYVPNVIYSCGSIVNNDELILPYGISDYASTYACINIKELTDAINKSN